MTSREEIERECCSIVLREAVVVHHLPATDRNSVLQAAVRHIAAHKGIHSEQDIKSLSTLMIQRENQGSSGGMKGYALPHVKHSLITRCSVGWFTVPQGIDFGALDRVPVNIVACVLSPPDDPYMHLGTMEVLFRHLRRDTFRRFLLEAQDAYEMMELLMEAAELPY